ncbi:MAG: GNAT family N-acetyltransferase [Bacillota bacterium]|nr:GNAT family N-acetyltransferase [Bacillota bacterium]
MKIVQLNPAHAEDYRKLRLEALHGDPEAFSSSFEEENAYSIDTFKNRFQSAFAFTFGAFEEEQLIGIVTLVKEQKLKLKHRASIFAMYVTPEKRGCGVGKRLVANAINKAKEDNAIQQLYLSVTATNEAAKKLYSSFGFEAYGRDKRALKVNNEYLDEDYMVLYF